MYSDWVSPTEEIQADPLPENVLQTFPVPVGKDVVQSVLKTFSEPIQHGMMRSSEVSSALRTPEQVQWTMQVIGYGLTLPLTEQTLIQQCIEVYDDWLSALYAPRKSVPPPIVEEPDSYVQTIFEQFCYLFSPRTKLNEAVYMEPHVFLCRRVLHITHTIVRKQNLKMSRETWNCLFHYLLRVSDILLAPPIDPAFNSLGSILSEKLVHVLFEAWLHSCVSCFPTPNLWKSLRELCCNWRHHRHVVEQWNKLTFSLTLHVIAHLYTPQYLSHLTTLPEEDVDFKQILADMPSDALVQCWFRMLHTLGNPVEISYPDVIANSPAFQKAAADFEEHKLKPITSCLTDLPQIFFEAMKGVATLVYLFLGHELPREEKAPSESSVPSTPIPGPRHSPLIRRRDSKDATSSSTSKLKPTTRWYVGSGQVPPSPGVASLQPSLSPGPHSPSSHTSILGSVGEIGKPRGNTLLHLFGSWLFEASVWPLHAKSMDSKRSSLTNTSAVRASFLDLSHAVDPAPPVSHDPLKALEYEAGRAEAFGALCSLFSSQPCGEPFLPIYLARFYHALDIGLQYNEELNQGQMLTRIILSSADLLHKDLQGINIMVPKFLSSLELILPRSDSPFKCIVDIRELRHASIRLLLSMLSLPLHFLYQPLPDLSSLTSSHPHPRLSSEESHTPSVSSLPFLSLRDRLLKLLFDAIDHETDSTNMQMLLHGLLAIIQDIVTYENAVAKMAAAEVGEDAEVSTILQDHPLLVPTRSDASFHSLQYSQYTSEDFTPALLFQRANRAAYSCLKSWEGSVQVSLAALELMAGLSRLQIENINHADCKQAVDWVCKYIEHQARKEHPQHSRDLHTSIVAAFKTLLTLVTLHPYLLGNKVCLTSVMKAIELGISGTFSVMDDGSSIYKGDKVLKPISGRVKEIAEFVLACVMEKVGSFPSPCGAEASSSLLSEKDLLARLPQGRKEECHFRYFVMDNSIILNLLEEPFKEDTNSLPTVTAIIRSPTGRYVWSLQLRHYPRSEQPSTQHLHSMPRPAPDTLTPTLPSVERRHWPDQVDMGPKMAVDDSIPSLQDILDDNTRDLHNTIAALTQRQIEMERQKDPRDFPTQVPFPDPSIALEPPEVKQGSETARLLLSHLGMLGIESIKDHPPARYPALAILDSSSPNFRTSLNSLDRLPTRFCDTVFVLYCKEGLTKCDDILACQHSLSNKPAEFIEFLHGLGWIVDPVNHPGFPGKIRPSKFEDANRPVGIDAQIPLRPFPYFADAMTEVAFIIPTLKPSASDSSTSLRSAESSDSGGQDTTCSVTTQVQGGAGEGVSPYTSLPVQLLREPQGSGVSESSIQAGEIDRHPTTIPRGKSRMEVVNVETPRRRLPVPQDCAVIVVWLEKFEDHVSFPLETMSNILHGGSFAAFGGSHKPTLKRTLPVLFIHVLSSGLYQIATKTTSSTRQDCLAGPLIDGMVVSRRTLGELVRQTAMNMCSRHRMENEGYSPPHVKRKRKIEECASAFTVHVPVAELYTKLFT